MKGPRSTGLKTRPLKSGSVRMLYESAVRNLTAPLQQRAEFRKISLGPIFGKRDRPRQIWWVRQGSNL